MSDARKLQPWKAREAAIEGALAEYAGIIREINAIFESPEFQAALEFERETGIIQWSTQLDRIKKLSADSDRVIARLWELVDERQKTDDGLKIVR
jgi:hypothetical protein